MGLIKYMASNIKSKPGSDIIIDYDFKPYLDKMNEVAKTMGFVVIVTSSFRKDDKVGGAIVVPAKKSNHMVGHAIDCNLQKGNVYYNSTAMGDGKGDDQLFCEEVVKKTGLRWGESFGTPDSVHFDDGLNINNVTFWEKKFKEFHT